jgi:hypothetical protein
LAETGGVTGGGGEWIGGKRSTPLEVATAVGGLGAGEFGVAAQPLKAAGDSISKQMARFIWVLSTNLNQGISGAP